MLLSVCLTCKYTVDSILSCWRWKEETQEKQGTQYCSGIITMGIVGFPHNASWSATSRTNYHTPVPNLRVGVSTLVIAVSPWTANLCAAAPRIWLAGWRVFGLSKTVFAWSITVCRLTGGADFQHGMTLCPLQLRCQSWQRFTANHAVKRSAGRAPQNKDPDWGERRSHTFGQHSIL